jgi:hypothetical protein
MLSPICILRMLHAVMTWELPKKLVEMQVYSFNTRRWGASSMREEQNTKEIFRCDIK